MDLSTAKEIIEKIIKEVDPLDFPDSAQSIPALVPVPGYPDFIEKLRDALEILKNVEK